MDLKTSIGLITFIELITAIGQSGHPFCRQLDDDFQAIVCIWSTTAHLSVPSRFHPWWPYSKRCCSRYWF